MRILITNDDGFDAAGIKSLKKIALAMSTEDNVFVVAPARNQSAKSRSVSYKTAFDIIKKNNLYLIHKKEKIMEMILGFILLLALFQIWLIPMMLNSKNVNWQISNRDNEPEHPPSLMLSRATKAKDNLKETLPIFLALAVWSIAAEVDISGLAMWWLILRIAHGALYMAGIGIIRTLVWLSSIIILIMMALALI